MRQPENRFNVLHAFRKILRQPENQNGAATACVAQWRIQQDFAG
ncbi:hypothetical protein GCWU000324_00194 [Kingella oralis ATCC 51147]|uniref:Uncharacterized protein n=1 Tax=Kingella oralis ATCC 51147 TaxID=629741 RepID=C4GH62_9NEIS|nr:hypothetical protein GCWU000324_00194 [Kingella oralis ATCC 51147]